jgi:maltose O-acetyltransferase
MTIATVWRKAHCKLRGRPDLEGLQAAGLRLGRNVFVAGGTYLDPDFCWLIEIGDESVISLQVMVLAHDASTRRHTGFTRVAPVHIGARVFIGARTIVLPGVTIGDDAIVGAGSVVRADVPAGQVVAGNPARVLTSAEDYLDRHTAAQARRPTWPRDGWTVAGGIGEVNKARMARELEAGEAYVR